MQELGKAESRGAGASSSNQSARHAPSKRRDPRQRATLSMRSTVDSGPRSGAESMDAAGSARCWAAGRDTTALGDFCKSLYCYAIAVLVGYYKIFCKSTKSLILC